MYFHSTFIAMPGATAGMKYIVRIKVLPPAYFIDERRQKDRHPEVDQQRDGKELEGVEHGVEEFLVLERPDIVVKSDKSAGEVNDIHLKEGNKEPQQNRVVFEHRETDDGRHEEEPRQYIPFDDVLGQSFLFIAIVFPLFPILCLIEPLH